MPFYGQGMNCAFEDCRILDEMLEASGEDPEAALPAFAERRKPHADAIADLALVNFVEMRDRVADPAFLLRKRIEHALHDLDSRAVSAPVQPRELLEHALPRRRGGSGRR